MPLEVTFGHGPESVAIVVDMASLFIPPLDVSGERRGGSCLCSSNSDKKKRENSRTMKGVGPGPKGARQHLSNKRLTNGDKSDFSETDGCFGKE
ncbi:hypothetical protein TNCV_2889371 [Trichonephila clavipes]|nr:hypothetical protein TNCV_2889371 [Trichonephila clavipes]